MTGIKPVAPNALASSNHNNISRLRKMIKNKDLEILRLKGEGKGDEVLELLNKLPLEVRVALIAELKEAISDLEEEAKEKEEQAKKDAEAKEKLEAEEKEKADEANVSTEGSDDTTTEPTTEDMVDAGFKPEGDAPTTENSEKIEGDEPTTGEGATIENVETNTTPEVTDTAPEAQSPTEALSNS